MLSRFAVRRPITTLMIFTAAVMLGLVSYRELSVQLFPDITFPGMGIFVGMQGQASDLLDKVTRPVEEIAAQLPNVKEVMSFTRNDRMWMRVTFEDNTNMRFAVIDAEERLNTWRQSLDDRRVNMFVFPFSTESFQTAFMDLSFQVDDPSMNLSQDFIDRVEQNLKSIQGVAEVQVYGRIYDSVRVVFDPDKLKAYDLSFNRIIGGVSAGAAEQPDLGRMETQAGNLFVRMGDRLRSAQQLAELPVDGKGVLRLRDVADLYQGGALDTTVFRADGKRSVGIEMRKEAGTNLIRLARVVRERVEEIDQSLPPGFHLVINNDDAQTIERVLDEMINLALVGVVLSGIVPLFFLRSVRMASIIFVSIPVSLIATFNFMYGFGLSINILTIIALAIGVSILVDNSIVVLENGFRLAERGVDPATAAATGGQEVGRALLASTATTIVVFVPVYFSEGEIRLIFREGALAIVFPLLISLAVALSLVPVLTSRALRMRLPGHRGPFSRWMERRVTRPLLSLWPWRRSGGTRARALPRELYRAILKRVLRNRGRTIFVIAVLVAFTLIEQYRSVNRGTLQQDARREYMSFHLIYPRGTKLSQADVSVRLVEDKLSKHPAIKRFWTRYDDEEASFWVRLKPIGERPGKMSFQEFERGLFDYIGPVPGGVVSEEGREQPMVETTVTYGEGGEIELRGPDLPVLINMAERVQAALTYFPQITKTELDLDDENPEVEVLLDRERGAMFGVDAGTLAQYVRSTRSSGTLASVKLENGTQQTDVIFEMGGPQRDTLDAIKELPIFSATAGSVPLAEVANFQTEYTSHRYRRQNGQESLDIKFYVRPGTKVNEISTDILDMVRQLPNPGGVGIEIGGQERSRRDREDQAQWVLWLGVVLVYIVMALAFESFWVPLVIWMSIPLVSVGVIWILLLSGKPMDEMAWFGLMVLAGLVVNAPIVMLDYAQRLRHERGYGRMRAVFQACDHRLRPVSMTVLTTILGLAPLAFLQSEGNDQWAGLALVVIGGLLSSTILTLLVIPCLYIVVEDLIRFVAPFFRWLMHIHARRFSQLSRFLEWLLFEFPRAVVTPANWRFWAWPVRLARALARGVLAAWRAFRQSAVLRWSIEGALWIFAGLTAAASLLLRPFRRRPATEPPLPIGEINREIPIEPPRSKHRPPEYSPAAPPLEVQSLRVIYPTPNWKLLARAIPSTRYAIGCRPIQGVDALTDINLRIEPGLFGLLGPNGAGKTTLMRCMAGLLPPTRGTVRIFGAPLRDHPEALAPLVAYLPQYHGLYDPMTLREFLSYFLLLRMEAQRTVLDHTQVERAVAAAADEVHLLDVLDQRLGTYSGGMRQRAGLARVLLAAPPIILVDEPTAGLDPVERVKVRLLLAQLARTRTVVFSTHLVEDLELSCRAVGILRQGRLLYSGPPSELLDNLRGRIWEVPLDNGDVPLAARDRIDVRLFRVAGPAGLRWRCLAPAAPTPDSATVAPRLEDAFLAILKSKMA